MNNRPFEPKKLVLSMIQPEPLPGSYRHTDRTIDEIVCQTLAETEMVAENGFDGIILQNMNDMPVKQIAEPEAIAYMTRIGLEIRRRFPELVMGILMNWDGVAGLRQQTRWRRFCTRGTFIHRRECDECRNPAGTMRGNRPS